MRAPEERAAYLREACGADEPLRRRVEAMLEAADVAGGSPAKPPAQLAPQALSHLSPASEKPGDHVGPYNLLQEIGEGGCGVVYHGRAGGAHPPPGRAQGHQARHGHAAGHRPVRGRAAGPGPDGPPRTSPASWTPGPPSTGRPYFVMELVRGIRITEYCDQHNLPTQRTAGAVHPGLPRHPARAPEGHHPPRHQALQHPGDACRRRARAQGD